MAQSNPLVPQLPHQVSVLARTSVRSSNHRFARVWVMHCTCGLVFGVNSCDWHLRRCPEDGGQPGLEVPPRSTWRWESVAGAIAGEDR